MEELIKLNNYTAGRDKLARLIQYSSRILWHTLQQHNASSKSVNKFKTLEFILANFRKLLRMGRFLDSLYVSRNLLNHEDLMVKVNCAFSKISYSLYLLCDHIIWFGRAGLAEVNTERWSRIGNKYWLLTIVMNLTRDFIEIQRLLQEKKLTIRFNKPELLIQQLVLFAKTHKDVAADTVRNVCDIFLPLSGLGYVSLNPSLIGLLGVISSSAGLYSMVVPFAKLPYT